MSRYSPIRIIRSLLDPQQYLRRRINWYRKRSSARPGKSEYINHLARHHGFDSYLEVATGKTGFKFKRIDRGAFRDVRRLLYGCPSDFDDGMEVSYRTEGDDIEPLLAEVRAEGRPNIALVDSDHLYEGSLRDIRAVYDLLESPGILVVHDCLPPFVQLAFPAPTPGIGDWCGVSYRSFLDFVLEGEGFDWRVVDGDYGCGLILKGGRFDFTPRWRKRMARAETPPRAALVEAWRDVPQDAHAEAFDFLHAHREELLRLIPIPALLSGLAGIARL